MIKYVVCTWPLKNNQHLQHSAFTTFTLVSVPDAFVAKAPCSERSGLCARCSCLCPGNLSRSVLAFKSSMEIQIQIESATNGGLQQQQQQQQQQERTHLKHDIITRPTWRLNCLSIHMDLQIEYMNQLPKPQACGGPYLPMVFRKTRGPSMGSPRIASARLRLLSSAGIHR